MEKYKINTQQFVVATDEQQAVAAAKTLGMGPFFGRLVLFPCSSHGFIGMKLASRGVQEFVLKAQIHAGGRGKGTFSSGLKGGVQLSRESVPFYIFNTLDSMNFS